MRPRRLIDSGVSLKLRCARAPDNICEAQTSGNVATLNVALLYFPITNAQLVVPLPPMFSIANFFAPSTW
jgi:hypothetical protein